MLPPEVSRADFAITATPILIDKQIKNRKFARATAVRLNVYTNPGFVEICVIGDAWQKSLHKNCRLTFQPGGTPLFRFDRHLPCGTDANLVPANHKSSRPSEGRYNP